jgi:hypothetical protein
MHIVYSFIIQTGQLATVGGVSFPGEDLLEKL